MADAYFRLGQIWPVRFAVRIERAKNTQTRGVGLDPRAVRAGVFNLPE